MLYSAQENSDFGSHHIYYLYEYMKNSKTMNKKFTDLEKKEMNDKLEWLLLKIRNRLLNPLNTDT